MKRPGARWKHTTGDEVLQLRALQLSDRWTLAVQRATRPLAKPVQIVGVLGVREAATLRTRTATPRRTPAATERGPRRSGAPNPWNVTLGLPRVVWNCAEGRPRPG